MSPAKIFRNISRIGFFVLLIMAFWLSTVNVQETPALEWTWDKLNHALGYFLLVVLLDLGFNTGRRIPAKSLFVFLYSLAIEFYQYFLPFREFSLLDIIANAAGVGAFLLLWLFVKQTAIYESFADQN